MAEGPLGRGAEMAGRQLGDWAADRWGAPIREAFESGKGLSGPLARALLDGVVVEQVVGAVWPSFLVLAALLGLHALAVWLGAPELERVMTGLVVCSALLWTVYGVVAGLRAAMPMLRLWLVTRLSPLAQARLVLFRLIRAEHRRARALLPQDGLAGALLRAALAELERRLDLTPERAAHALAEHLAPMLLTHLLGRLGLLVAPVAGALVYYRFAIYPGLLAMAGAGPWAIALYPFAALSDALLGTGLRAALLGL
ncbi:hypothetical protein [Pseudoroseomonas cervicalis]|uniref:hypothetical protein n=1 Tax=Teichococcus cervicalis TaxID=204525 RepID=UPI00277D4005|nr:hypothetical protein [Pseudoroseomonas cervicalis]MDQ1078504.1 hypothetical protein [Pseudoroseomonas cervicalis]